MCGIAGIVGHSSVNQALYDALLVLQHRGQDAAGIVTVDNDSFRLRKANGLVSDVFQLKHIQRLQGLSGIGHVRYPTAGSSSAAEAQPFYVNYPFGISLVHNGNIINSNQVRKDLQNCSKRHINTTSDSELLLNVLADALSKTEELSVEDIFTAIKNVNNIVSGGYAAIALIIGHGMIAFRDPYGIRPLCLGKRQAEDGRIEYMVASESVALDAVGFRFVRDVEPGEGVFMGFDGSLHTAICSEKATLTPCIFEYIYFARPDSFIDKVSVYSARLEMGKRLGARIKKEWREMDIDVVIPIPETSCDIALEIAQCIGKPYRQGFVKNRYVGRTFIMPEQSTRKQSVRRKLNAIYSEFKGKNVVLVDDSIVRGTTSQQIVEMVKDCGAKNIYLVSAAPAIRFPNVYGIDMPSAQELIAAGRSEEEVASLINVDALMFQTIEDLFDSIQTLNPDILDFEASVFNGKYITGDITQPYLDTLAYLRNNESRQNTIEALHLELYNEGDFS